MRAITPEGLALIRQFEGFSATPYRCPGGYLTIGYGHVVRDASAITAPITRQQAVLLLKEDVRQAQLAALRLIHVPLTDGQYDALVSFTFNLGAGALQRSTLRRVVNREAHAEVPDQLRRWVWADGRRLAGLIRRREAEAARYVTLPR